tara:strand:+ start:1629 stop:1838 length:210 start_codon:yes stop_codon:yes gene_type:complete
MEMEVRMKTIFTISGKKYLLKYERKMPEKEVLKMKSFVTNKGQKLIKTDKFKIKKIIEKDKERIYDISL